MDHLKAAIARLRAFRDSWNEGDQIDEESKLTADDLDLVLMEVEGRFDPTPAATAGTMLDEMRHPDAGRAKPDKGFATNGE